MSCRGSSFGDLSCLGVHEYKLLVDLVGWILEVILQIKLCVCGKISNKRSVFLQVVFQEVSVLGRSFDTGSIQGWQEFVYILVLVGNRHIPFEGVNNFYLQRVAVCRS